MASSYDYLTPEAKARMKIDQQLEASGRVIQDYRNAAVDVALGVAVSEVPTAEGPADYVLLFGSAGGGDYRSQACGYHPYGY